MVHGDDDIVFAAISLVKQRVGGKGTDDIETLLARPFDHRPDESDLFVAKFAAFTRMRVEAANGNAAARQFQSPAGLGGQFNGPFDGFGAQMRGHQFERKMGGGQGNAQPAAAVVLRRATSWRFFGAGQLGKKLRLADEGLAGAEDGLFIERRGDERVHFLAQTAPGAIGQRVPGRRGRRKGSRGSDRRPKVPQGDCEKKTAGAPRPGNPQRAGSDRAPG